MSRKRLLWSLLAAAGVIGLLTLARGFPWQRAVATLADVNVRLLVTALVINLLSPIAKGLGWHLLLSRVAPNRWWVAQEANLVGTAVNSVAAGISGEAARVAMVVEREGVPVRSAVVSVVWARGVEALGLALFLLIAPLMLRLPPTLRGLQLAAGLVVVTALAAGRFRGWETLVVRLPAGVRDAARDLAKMSRGARLVAPVGLALVSWAAEWVTYHLAFRAAHLHVSYAASFTALMAVNLGGVIRVTPANVGLMQAAIVGALLPFGIDPDRSVAAGLALQAIEVFPVLALTLPLIGRAGLKRLRAEAAKLPEVA